MSLKRLVVPAAVGALVACLALLLAPTLPGRALAAPSASPLMLIIPGAALDGSAVRLEPALFLGAAQMGEKVPAEQQVPVKTLPGQKVEPCDLALGEKAI